jgi:hypothetical protein
MFPRSLVALTTGEFTCRMKGFALLLDCCTGGSDGTLKNASLDGWTFNGMFELQTGDAETLMGFLRLLWSSSLDGPSAP